MQAKLERAGEITVVHLSGHIDYESADKFKDSCLKALNNQKVVFNLENLSFVGSSGITPFLETMITLSESNKNIMKFCRVGSEFRKIFASGALKDIEICEDVETAKSAVLSTVDVVSLPD